MRKHRKKYYYAAGLISIILLPILCLLHLKKINAFTQYSAMDLQMWDGKDTLGTKGIKSFLNSKEYTIVNLTGENESDKLKLENAEKQIEKLILSKDSLNGVKFHFGCKAQYWTYVKALDILAEKKARFYVPYKDDIWFANPREPKRQKSTPITYFVCGNIEHEYSEPKIDMEEIIALLKKYSLPIIAYIFMMFFAFKRIGQSI